MGPVEAVTVGPVVVVIPNTTGGTSSLAYRIMDGGRYWMLWWWEWTAHGLLGLVLLVAGGRRERAAGAALISVWCVMAGASALTIPSISRYAAQIAPLMRIASSAGLFALVYLGWRSMLALPKFAWSKSAQPREPRERRP